MAVRGSDRQGERHGLARQERARPGQREGGWRAGHARRQREAALWCLGLDFAAYAASAIIVAHVPAVLAMRLATAHCICATAEFAADTTGCTAIAMEVPAVLTLRPITVKFATHAAFASGLRCRNCEH